MANELSCTHHQLLLSCSLEEQNLGFIKTFEEQIEPEPQTARVTEAEERRGRRSSEAWRFSTFLAEKNEQMQNREDSNAKSRTAFLPGMPEEKSSWRPAFRL